MHYRFYLLDRVGAFIDVADALCADDHAARVEAERRLGGAPAIEVWQQGRFVTQVDRRLGGLAYDPSATRPKHLARPVGRL